MKKLFLLLCMLPMLAIAGRAQEARQDVSLSFMGTIQPYVNGGTNNVTFKSTLGAGLLLSYRYQLTPNGAIEANYSYSRFTDKFATSSVYYVRVYTSMQEATFAYVRTIPYKRFNPFIEGGGGIQFFSPLGFKTTSYDTEQSEALVGQFGGGIAYELSPSWDLRVQYRGYISKPETFGLSTFSTGRYYLVSQPAIGFAYHF
ncbi:MAG TPA: outer membrane beta-barrel protein [Acidobacteriaceae bacterium]|jgi:opacity protein-like surface antigen|nr:outer membrane beta-barrel protein [Acidobacteriaceae bacterium]